MTRLTKHEALDLALRTVQSPPHSVGKDVTPLQDTHFFRWTLEDGTEVSLMVGRVEK